MIRVQVRPHETLEAALRRFKRQCNYAGVFRLAKKYSYHEKRSDKRRREDRERIRNIQRVLRKARQKTKPRSVKRSKVKVGSSEETMADATLNTSSTTGAKPAAGDATTTPATPATAPQTAPESAPQTAPTTDTQATATPQPLPAATEGNVAVAKVSGGSDAPATPGTGAQSAEA